MTEVKKASTVVIALLSFQLVLLLALVPSTIAITPSCDTGNIPYLGHNYRVQLSPCSVSGVALHTTVGATGTTDNTAITKVTFEYDTPANTMFATDAVLGTSPFVTSGHALDTPGTWSVLTTFYAGSSEVFHHVLNMQVQILVLSELPLGTIAAVGAALVGLVAVSRLSKTFSVSTPTG